MASMAFGIFPVSCNLFFLLLVLIILFYPFMKPIYYREKLPKVILTLRTVLNPLNWPALVKKNCFRLLYLLFLLYIPGVIVDEWSVLHGADVANISDSGALALQALNPWTQICGKADLFLFDKYGFLYHWPVYIFLCWLLYSWLKKPGFLKGASLFAIAMFFVPVVDPWQKIADLAEYPPYFFMNGFMAFLAWVLYLLYLRIKKPIPEFSFTFPF